MANMTPCDRCFVAPCICAGTWKRCRDCGHVRLTKYFGHGRRDALVSYDLSTQKNASVKFDEQDGFTASLGFGDLACGCTNLEDASNAVDLAAAFAEGGLTRVAAVCGIGTGLTFTK
jgi:hypothetical protein